ncbi:FtsH protease activity modulator HflK [Luteimonas sp. MC1750]|uniref:FtsH protease activity modulator HflK n=1 Tax=Luteimonas sp. MC1750 TaxID=2799326 RepID=UPI0018F0796D|nr:FtsH protease activity modulator HflK [Luteimonas sp. MC1750]QQO06637.1 FtsH protease activity modulator HflK [Luteimonas sp. MC1750]
MAWNIPGKNNDDRGSGRDGGNNGRQNPWPPRRSSGGGRGRGPFDGLVDQLRGLFGGAGGGGHPLRWIGIALALWLAFNCFVLVGEQDRGVVLRFGKFSRVMQPGPNFKLPWPIERVTKLNTTGVRTFSNALPVLTRDENIVTVSFNVQYRISDPEMYLFGSRDADRVLEQVAQSAVREQIGRANLDSALNARGPLSAAAATSLQASLETYRTGLIVTELSLQDARPPEEVKPAFDEVNSAQQMNERLVNEARAYAARIVPEARGQAQRVRTTAEGYKTASVANASGDAQRFSLLVDEYKKAPDVTRKRLWLETVEDVLAENRTVIGGDGRQLIYVPMAGQGAGAQPLLTPDMVAPAADARESEAVVPAASSNLPRPPREGASR